MTSLFRFPVGVCLLLAVSVTATAAADDKPYNVLMIMIDDYAAQLNTVGHKSPVKTPNMERLAARGTWFTQAYNDSPICCASRTAILTGIHTTRTGVYYNNQGYRRSGRWYADVRTLPGQFLANGYLTAGYGKIAHTTFMEDDVKDYTPGYYKMHRHPEHVRYTDGDLLRDKIIPGSKVVTPGPAAPHWAWGVLPDDWDRDDPEKMQHDTEIANYTIALLNEPHDKPFFAICGFWRPHVRWIVPKRYYDMHPLDSITIPEGHLPGDNDDLPKPGRWIATHRREHADIVAAGLWKKCIQAHYASVSYVDDQIGRVLDALEASGHNDDTIVVFLSDNGFHLGEKDHWLKFALWEQTNHVVFAVSVPGMPVQEVDTPVSLIDIYPTLVGLCGLDTPEHTLDGVNLSEILAGRSNNRGNGEPVLSTYGRGNHSLRDARFRYIRYRDGSEELYDNAADPYEWKNLADLPEFADVKTRLAKHLPTENAPQISPAGLTGVLHAVWEDEAFTDEPWPPVE